MGSHDSLSDLHPEHSSVWSQDSIRYGPSGANLVEFHHKIWPLSNILSFPSEAYRIESFHEFRDFVAI